MAEVKREHRELAAAVVGWNNVWRIESWLQTGGSLDHLPMAEENDIAQAIADAEERGAARREEWTCRPLSREPLTANRAAIALALRNTYSAYYGTPTVGVGDVDDVWFALAAAVLGLLEGEP